MHIVEKLIFSNTHIMEVVIGLARYEKVILHNTHIMHVVVSVILATYIQMCILLKNILDGGDTCFIRRSKNARIKRLIHLKRGFLRNVL